MSLAQAATFADPGFNIYIHGIETHLHRNNANINYHCFVCFKCLLVNTVFKRNNRMLPIVRTYPRPHRDSA